MASEQKPINRSRLRLIAGKIYYTARRYMQWHISNIQWANKQSEKKLQYSVFDHQTPLIRELSGHKMWMQYNKIDNLRIASYEINGLIIHPGHTFSFWRTVGKPTKRKGYRPAMVLSHGQIEAGIGGGLCQLSNLIYWMSLHTPLQITERHRHSYDVFPDTNRKLPFGSGATCAYPYIDLQVYNPTNDAYQLIVYLTDEYLVGQYRSGSEPQFKYKIYEKDHWITHKFGHGYVRHNIIRRQIHTEDGELVDDEYVTENHAIMTYEPFLNDGSAGK